MNLKLQSGTSFYVYIFTFVAYFVSDLKRKNVEVKSVLQINILHPFRALLTNLLKMIYLVVQISHVINIGHVHDVDIDFAGDVGTYAICAYMYLLFHKTL